MEINEKIVKKLGTLSRIKIEDSQVPEISKNLTDILNWVSQLEKINTDDVKPMFNIAFNPLPLRQDVVAPFGTREEIMANAPQTDTNKEFFAVPKVVK
jgi:aspartyl-tRNA(Asn)/glutamyl-tRNA(Gln) amidotransferase subunit C